MCRKIKLWKIELSTIWLAKHSHSELISSNSFFLQGPQIGQAYEVSQSKRTVQKVPGGCSGANQYHADRFTNSLWLSTYNVLLPAKTGLNTGYHAWLLKRKNSTLGKSQRIARWYLLAENNILTNTLKHGHKSIIIKCCTYFWGGKPMFRCCTLFKKDIWHCDPQYKYSC